MLKDRYKAILFDLDGTLLPMDMEVFTNGYFKELYKTVNLPQIPIQSFVDAIWKGTYSMMKNDGSKTSGVLSEDPKVSCGLWNSVGVSPSPQRFIPSRCVVY